MNKLLHRSKLFVDRNAPTILTVIGGIGVVVTAVITAKQTPKALEVLRAAKEEKGEELTKTEKVLTAAPAYIPAVITGAATIACIFGANALNKHQQAALMSAYALLDNSYKEYKKKVDELYGEEAGARVRAEITKDHMDESDIPEEDDGKLLFFDDYSSRYFRSTIEQVQKAEYNLNRALFMWDYVSLNEFYKDLGLEPIDTGWVTGWTRPINQERHWQEWVDFIHEKVVLDDGLECYIIRMHGEPTMYFENYY
jgi:hypothetical protein